MPITLDCYNGRRMDQQDDCKVHSEPLMVSLSNHDLLVLASFDKRKMSRSKWMPFFAIVLDGPMQELTTRPKLGSRERRPRRWILSNAAAAGRRYGSGPETRPTMRRKS